MRGFGPLIGVFLGALFLEYLLTCFYLPAPSFNVPACSTPSACLRETGIEGAYARDVAYAWFHANAARLAVSRREKLCEGQTAKEIIHLLLSTGKDIETHVALAVKYADLANLDALRELRYMYDELNATGAYCLSDRPLARVQGEVWDNILAIDRGKGSTPLAQRLLQAERDNKALAAIFATHAFVESIPLVGHAVRWIRIALSSDVDEDAYFSAEDFVNRSVGRYGSVYSAFRDLWSAYEAARRDADALAKDVERRAEDLEEEIDEILSEASDYSLAGLTWDRIAAFAPREARGGEVLSDPERFVSDVSIRRALYVRRIEEGLTRYRSTYSGKYCYLADARAYLSRLEDLRREAGDYLNALKSLSKACADHVSSYNPSSAYVRTLLRGYVKEIEGGDMGACADALRLMEEDKKYASTEALLEACEERAEEYEDYACTGDVFERLDCCRAFLERKRQELYSSDLYAQYMEMRATVERMLGLVDDDALFSAYLSLPVYPEDEKELRSAMKRLIEIYKKLKRLVEEIYAPQIVYEGYLDAFQMSEMNVVFIVDLGDVDLDYRIKLPLQAYTYRVLEANGLSVNVKGDEAFLRGGGWARVWILAYPAEFDVERMGEDMGRIYVRIRYEGQVPARYPLSGEVVSSTPSVRASGGYIYFPGPGEAIVAENALEMEYEEDENSVTVVLSNVSEESYTGTVFIPVSAEDLPRGCEPFGSGALCSVRLDPYERKALTFEGVFREDLLPEAPPLEQEVDRVRVEREEGPDRNTPLSLISLLRSWWERAKELGVASYISFDENTLSDIERQVRETNDADVLRALTTLLRATVSGTKRFVRARVASLSDVEGAEKAYSLALQALQAKDYMLALAIAAAVRGEEETPPPPVLPFLLSLLGLGGVGAYIRFQPRLFARRIPRIPRI